MLVLLLFFLSGATALVYEVIWSKYLALMFGSTVQAQTVVLAVFMGGLALGNRLFGKWTAGLKQPLAVYGIIEAAIGLYAFVFHGIYSLADFTFIGIGSKFAENSGALLALKGVLAIALLIIPTVLMGGTLPLLAGWLERTDTDAGRGAARFYSTNSLGAVFGAGVAGFYLVREWGMLASLQLAAFVNFAVAAGAILISRQTGDLTPKPVEPASETSAAIQRGAVWLVAVTGGVSMGLEVLASRAVALFVGGSLQSFAIVLMAFILGIGLGAAAVATKRFSKWEHPATMFGMLVGAAALTAMFVWRVEGWAIFYSTARSALAPNEFGYLIHQLIVGVLAMVALGMPAALLGAVLPMAIRASGGGSKNVSDQVGRLLTWNTIGAVVGVLLTGFFLMPALGLRGSFLALAGVLALIAALNGLRLKSPRLIVGGAGVAVGLGLLATVNEGPWRHILGSGLFRMRGLKLTPETVQMRQREMNIDFYKDAADATVLVESRVNPDGPKQFILRINGKADASTFGDLSTQYLLGHLPFFARPESKDVFILGFGSGITAGAVLGHPVTSLTVAENCGPVLDAAPIFEKWNRGALKDARMRLKREDARTVLKVSEKKYDVIISEPSNPWVAGIGSVFTQEFYKLCQSRLSEGGMMAQWFHIYEMHDGIVDLVLNTFSSVFPNMEIWETQNGDIVLLGSMKAWESTPTAYQKVFERERPRADLVEIGITTPVSVLARQLASQRTAFAVASGTAIQSDEFPVLEYKAPEAFFIGQTAQRLFLLDERTRQSALAPQVKRQSLPLLPEPILHGIFKDYSSANPDLLNYLKWRASSVRSADTHGVYEADPILPVIFRPAQSYLPAVTNNLSAAEATLMQAAAEVAQDPLGAEAALQKMEAAVAAQANVESKDMRWRPAAAATSVARARLARGEFEKAGKVIELGRKFEPENVELLYLQRLFERVGN